MEAKPRTAIAEVLATEQRHYETTIHQPGWAIPTSNGGAVVFPGETYTDVETVDRFWIRFRGGGREEAFDLPADALPARAGQSIAVVSIGGGAVAVANLSTGKRRHLVERAPQVESRLAKWPVLAGFAGAAVAGLILMNRTTPQNIRPEVKAQLPSTVCDMGPGDMCDRYMADRRAAGALQAQKYRDASRAAFAWADKQAADRGLRQHLPPADMTDLVLQSPAMAKLPESDRAEWRRAREAQWRLGPEGPYEREIRIAWGLESRWPLLYLAGLLALVLIPVWLAARAVGSAVRDAKARDAAVDRELAAAFAGAAAAKPAGAGP